MLPCVCGVCVVLKLFLVSKTPSKVNHEWCRERAFDRRDDTIQIKEDAKRSSIKNMNREDDWERKEELQKQNKEENALREKRTIIKKCKRKSGCGWREITDKIEQETTDKIEKAATDKATDKIETRSNW